MAWYERIDLSRIPDEVRYRLFDYATEVKRLRPHDLGISSSMFSRIKSRSARVSDSVLVKVLQRLTREEFARLLSAGEKLVVAGIVRDDGSVDYASAIEFVKHMLRDEYLKQLLLRLVIEHFREDLRKMLGISFAGVKPKWSEDFENLSDERKRRSNVKSKK